MRQITRGHTKQDSQVMVCRSSNGVISKLAGVQVKVTIRKVW